MRSKNQDIQSIASSNSLYSSGLNNEKCYQHKRVSDSEVSHYGLFPCTTYKEFKFLASTTQTTQVSISCMFLLAFIDSEQV